MSVTGPVCPSNLATLTCNENPPMSEWLCCSASCLCTTNWPVQTHLQVSRACYIQISKYRSSHNSNILFDPSGVMLQTCDLTSQMRTSDSAVPVPRMRPSGWNEADEYPFWTVGSLTCIIIKCLPTYQSIFELWAKHVLSYMDSSPSANLLGHSSVRAASITITSKDVPFKSLSLLISEPSPWNSVDSKILYMCEI